MSGDEDGGRLSLRDAAIAQALAGIVEAGYLVAASDGVLAEEEVAVLAAVIIALVEDATEDGIVALIKAADRALARDGWDARVEAMAEHINGLENDDVSWAALLTAAAVLISDDEFVEGEEDEIYAAISDALGYEREDAVTALEEAATILEEWAEE